MTPLQLDLIEARRAALTGDLWDVDDAEYVGDQVRADLDDLLAEVRRLRRESAEARAVCESLAARVAAQSELLARRAERTEG